MDKPEEQPEEQPQEQQDEKPTAANPNEPLSSKEVVSIIDIMEEIEEEQAHPEEVEPKADSSTADENVKKEESATPAPPDPIINISADEYTPTGSLGIEIPDEIKRSNVPPPLYAPELKPKTRPTVEDQDATRVSPDVAYPGETKLEKDLPSFKPQSSKPTGSPIRDTDDDVTQAYIPTSAQRSQPLRPNQPSTSPVEEDPDATRPMRGPIREQPKRDPANQSRPRQNRPQSGYYQKPAEQLPPRQSRPTQPVRQPVRESNRGRVPDSSADFKQSIPQPYDTRRQPGGCLRRVVVWSILLFIVGFSLSVISLSATYLYIAWDLPSPNDLKARTSDFQTAFILDRDGNELYRFTDQNTGNRTQVGLNQIADVLEQATIATEDARFYTNPGFDPIGIMRAILQAYQEGEFVSGASTITQQVARALLLDEEERTQRTFSRKVREIILAAEINRRWPKEDILEIYLNEINYGNRAYGIQAAAETYFNKSAADLTLEEAAVLAGLPQAPALWDPYTAPDKAIGRMSEVLTLMVAEGYVTRDEAQAAIDSMAVRVYEMTPPEVTITHPHAVFYVLQQLEEANDAQAIYRAGLRVYTTIDPRMQQIAEQVIADNRNNINAFGANNASLVAIDPRNGQVLAMVGSVDFNDEQISGQVNMAVAPRQPGSTIKPLVYLAAMQEGWNPATLIWDIPTQFPDAPNPPYLPKNYDDRFHGPLLLREALGNSYNVTAVKAMEYVGTCDFIDFVRNRFQLLSLDSAGCIETGRPTNYGLALALGGGEITPMEMVTAYSTLANQGSQISPYTIQRIENSNGDVLFEREAQPQIGVIPPQNVHLITDILTDNNARQPSFGLNNNLVIPGHVVAAKTGTSGSDRFDVRDGWTIGYTPNLAAGVWVGNTDNRPLAEGASGYGVASPIWSSFMNQVLVNQSPLGFARPEGIVELEICARSGAVPNDDCPQRQRELFTNTSPPLGAENDFLQRVPVDLWTGLQASAACGESVYEASFINLQVNVQPEERAREEQAVLTWIQDTQAGRDWAAAQNLVLPSGGNLLLPPLLTCDGTTPRPVYQITSPISGQELQGVVDIMGDARGPGVVGYRIDYGLSHSPEGWSTLTEVRDGEPNGNVLMRLDTSTIPPGPFTLRLTLIGPDNPYTAETDNVILETTLPLSIA
ncbi:MAG: transglycosylase domain-containing protein, partial [Chloroflexota bacterium]